MPDSADRCARAPAWMPTQRADWRSLAAIAAALALLFVPQWYPVSAPWVFAWIPATVLACCMSHVVVHNHCHCPIFASGVANRGFNLVASLARGHCASDVYLAHVVNHHAEQGRPADWIAPTLGGTGHPLVRLARFVVRASASMVRERRRLGRRALALVPEPFGSSLRWEKRLLPAVVLLLLVHDWRSAGLHVLLPWALSLAWLVGVNYIQHEGCEPDSRWGHSRNFTGPLANWLLFNNGYHTVHHADPGVHWSETRSMHERLAPRVPPHLHEPCALRYMIRRYLRRPSDD